MGVQRWVIDLPEGWDRKRVKYLARFVGGGTPDKSKLEFWNGDIPWVSPKDMKTDLIYDSEDHITRAGLESSAASLIAPGAALIVVRSGILRHSIPVAINKVSVSINQDMRAILPSDSINPGDKFELVFKNLLEALFVERMDQNEEIFARFMNDKSFQNIVTGWLSSEAYRKLRLSANNILGEQRLEQIDSIP
jgi:Type I restriction modification DNA specificity domain